jgi:hypothetical protein
MGTEGRKKLTGYKKHTSIWPLIAGLFVVAAIALLAGLALES